MSAPSTAVHPAALPRFPQVRAAIFDLDGTLVDTQGDFLAALNAMLDELGLRRVDAAFVARTVGKGSEHLLRRTLTEVGGAPEAYAAAWAAYERHYLAINGRHAQVFPGVHEGLRRLQAAGLPLACVTNKPTAFARPLLLSLGLEPAFVVVYGGDAFEQRKPHPRPLLAACEALGTAPAQTLMVGDSRNDAEAAHAAGCPVVLLRHGYNHGEPVDEVPADAHLDTLLALWPA